MMTSNCEGYPMTLIEAMQFGCVPMVLNNFSSLKDIITNQKDGIIIPPKKELIFSKELNTLMNNHKIRKQLALCAIKSAKKNTIEQIGTFWLNFLNKK